MSLPVYTEADMGTKHYTTGRVRTSRYGGRYVDTYVNEAGHVFQSGAGAFAEPVWPDVPDSLDCGVGSTLMEVIEQADPWADANGQTKDNGVTRGTINATGSATYTLYAGDTYSVEAFAESPSTGSNPNLNLTVYKNPTFSHDPSAIVHNSDTPAIPAASMVYTDTVADGDFYNAVITSTADAPDTPVSCGTESTYSGGEAFPTDTFITLGAGLGTVELDYDAFSVPDKFEVWIAGVKVIDTGYRGDVSYQSALDAELASMGLSPETITAGGSGTATFNKLTTATIALVRVYAPLPGTAWNFTLMCPVP